MLDKMIWSVFGNGDVMNYEDYNSALAKAGPGVTGIMLARWGPMI